MSNDQNPEFFGGRQLEAAYHSNMTKQFVIRSTPCDHVRVLAIHRPEKRNALSQQVIDCFLEELKDASHDEGCRVIVVTGTEAMFCGTGPIAFALGPVFC